MCRECRTGRLAIAGLSATQSGSMSVYGMYPRERIRVGARIDYGRRRNSNAYAMVHALQAKGEVRW